MAIVQRHQALGKPVPPASAGSGCWYLQRPKSLGHSCGVHLDKLNGIDSIVRCEASNSRYVVQTTVEIKQQNNSKSRAFMWVILERPAKLETAENPWPKGEYDLTVRRTTGRQLQRWTPLRFSGVAMMNDNCFC